MYDIHSHILPQLDDGAKSREAALELCSMARAEGVSAIVATPHIREGVWPNRHAEIAGRLEELREDVARRGIDIEVVLGAELYLSPDIVEAVREGVYPTYAGDRRYLLLELPNHFVPQLVENLVFELRTSGITPVIAHPERNPQLVAKPALMEELARLGSVLQLTAMSITGGFGRRARRAARELLDRGLAHAVASDAHHPRYRPALLGAAYRQVAARHGEERAHSLFVLNPERVLRGQPVDTRIPLPARPAGLRRLWARLLGGGP